MTVYDLIRGSLVQEAESMPCDSAAAVSRVMAELRRRGALNPERGKQPENPQKNP